MKHLREVVLDLCWFKEEFFHQLQDIPVTKVYLGSTLTELPIGCPHCERSTLTDVILSIKTIKEAFLDEPGWLYTEEPDIWYDDREGFTDLELIRLNDLPILQANTDFIAFTGRQSDIDLIKALSEIKTLKIRTNKHRISPYTIETIEKSLSGVEVILFEKM